MKSHEFLDLALSGTRITGDHIDELLRHRVKEDEYIDYKAGDVLKETDIQNTIRKYMSGFANSDGGVLIIGIRDENEIPVEITGYDPDELRGGFEGWAADCIKPIAGHFNPLPKFFVIEHDSGKGILVCVVARSYSAVPLVEKRKVSYYVRLEDRMMPLTDALQADLLMGRRARPNFSLIDWKVTNLKNVQTPNNDRKLEFDLEIEFENSGLVWAENCRYGIVHESITDSRALSQNSYLRTFIDFDSDVLREGRLWRSVKHLHYSREVRIDRPFDIGHAPFNGNASLPFGVNYDYVWKAALYLTAKNSPPIWYQVTLNIDSGLKEHLSLTNRGLPSGWDGLSISRLYKIRPVVGYFEL